MGLLEKMSADRFTDCELEGFGKFTVRHLRICEYEAIREIEDPSVKTRSYLSESIYEDGEKVFATPAEVTRIHPDTLARLAEKIREVQSVDAAKKNSQAPGFLALKCDVAIELKKTFSQLADLHVDELMLVGAHIWERKRVKARQTHARFLTVCAAIQAKGVADFDPQAFYLGLLDEVTGKEAAADEQQAPLTPEEEKMLAEFFAEDERNHDEDQD